MSERYSETRTYREGSRGGTDGYDAPFNSRVQLPIQQSISSISRNPNEQRLQERIRHQDTTVQWVNDPINGNEKFRVTINIDGFDRNEVNIRVEGNKLHVYGEHLENKNHSTAKKIIEKSYELPRDIDTFSPQVTFPTPITMQVDFPSRHTNVIADDGRLSTKRISDFDSIHRTSPGFSHEKSSTEYTSTRKIGGGSGVERTSSPRIQSSYDDLYGGNNPNRNSSSSSTRQYQSYSNQSPSRRDYTSTTTTGPYNTSTNPTYTYRTTGSDFQPKTTYPSSSYGDNGTSYERSFTETRRETDQRRSSPISGVQSSRDVQHHRSGSPSIGRSLDEDRFRTSLTIGPSGISSPSSTHNVEVREYSRRVGGTGSSINEPFLFTHGFNSDAFYRSAFQPQIITDNSGQKGIEMKLPVDNYEPNEIKVSVNGNDLIVQAEHNVDRPPTASTRAYFYKQVSLPPNTDFSTLQSQYHPDGRLHITAKLSQDQASIKYN